VFSKPPLDGPESVLAYLARYTHRVAISNHRLIELDEDHIRFRYKDYRSRRTRHLELGLHEFARRFLLHVLPRRFVRIRYYGFLANGCRQRRIAQCLQALGAPARDPAPESDALSVIPLAVSVVGLLPTPTRLCPACCSAPMSCVQLLERPPPFLRCPHPRV
jgi:hypothetical protein